MSHTESWKPNPNSVGEPKRTALATAMQMPTTTNGPATARRSAIRLAVGREPRRATTTAATTARRIAVTTIVGRAPTARPRTAEPAAARARSSERSGSAELIRSVDRRRRAAPIMLRAKPAATAAS